MATIDILPLPPRTPQPQERWLVVQGIRSNQWFKHIYDRANIPNEVEQLYERTGAQLVWFIPQAKGYQTARVEVGRFACLARDTPVAVVVGNNRLQVLHDR